MAVIHALMTVHSGGCEIRGRHEVCEDGSTVRHLIVAATFTPEPGATLRERIRLARTAALFATRNGQAHERR